MANDITKFLICKGNSRDLAFIYRHAMNILDSELIEASDYHNNLSILMEKLGGDGSEMDLHGWSEIEEVDFDQSGQELQILTFTPYGNLEPLTDFLQKRFPDCEFVCGEDVDYEEEED